jgi:D-alanyl-D-alanine carboxypeptidase
MRSTTAGRAVLVALAAVFLIGVPGASSAADASAPPTIAPPSLEWALASLLPQGALLTADAAADGTFAPAARLPACGVQDIPTRYGKLKHWRKTLLDTNLKLKRSYKPWDLRSVSRANIKGDGKVRKIMIADLKALARAARKAGKPLAVRSAYRSYETQKSLFAYYVRTYGDERALKFSARAGHSEHQMGTTIDFTTAPGVPLTTKFGDSPAGKWLARNGWKYGFIMSYPKGKKSASCYSYEPWHWRYFGRDRARQIHERGQVPRRYLWENFESAP